MNINDLLVVGGTQLGLKLPNKASSPLENTLAADGMSIVLAQESSEWSTIVDYWPNASEALVAGREGYLGRTIVDASPTLFAPIALDSTSTVKQAFAGDYHTLLLLEDGTIYAYGANNNGGLGLGHLNSRALPERVGLDSDWTKVVAGDYMSAALKSDGTLWLWGRNDITFSPLGSGRPTNNSIPFSAGTRRYKDVALGGSCILAVGEDGLLYGSGRADFGQMGIGSSPQKVGFMVRVAPTLTNISKVSCRGAHTAVLTDSGTLYTFGSNNFGPIGNGYSGSNVLSPHSLGSGWLDVYAGTTGTFGIKSDGLYGWGYNKRNILGIDTVGNNVLVPTLTKALSGIRMVSTHSSSSLFITDTHVWRTGYNGYGQLGTGDISDLAEWTQLAGFQNPKGASLGQFNSIIWN